jgi:hypothetical protein
MGLKMAVKNPFSTVFFECTGGAMAWALSDDPQSRNGDARCQDSIAHYTLFNKFSFILRNRYSLLNG